jgi:hypothetical protein
MSGYTMTQGELLYCLPAAVTRNSYTTIVPISGIATTGTVGRCIVPANYFNAAGKAIYYRARGTLQSAAGTATFSFTGGLDSTGGTLGKTLFATANLTPATGTIVFDIEGDITCQVVGQANSTLASNGTVRTAGTTANGWITTVNPTGGALVGDQMLFSNSITTLDYEVNQYLELFSTCSASSATNQIILQQFKVYGEN